MNFRVSEIQPDPLTSGREGDVDDLEAEDLYPFYDVGQIDSIAEFAVDTDDEYLEE